MTGLQDWLNSWTTSCSMAIYLEEGVHTIL